MTRFYALLTVALVVGCSAPRWERHEQLRPLMGTEFRLVMYAEDAEQATRAADAAWARMSAVEELMSDYIGQSELSRLSAVSREHEPPVSVAVSEELFSVLLAARGVWELSGGAFDVTVGPCVRLWRRAARRGEPPDEERLSAARAASGQEKLRLHAEGRRVELLASDMRLDLGGIAKGYALDQALAVLARHGIERALVDGGGDLRLGEPPPGEDGWLVAVEGDPHGRRAARCGVATSGQSGRSFTWEGLRFSHVVDPRTGVGLTHEVAVTVIADTAMAADALASAASVLGAGPGIAWIEGLEGVEAQFRTPRPQPGQKAAGAPCETSGYGMRMRPDAQP